MAPVETEDANFTSPDINNMLLELHLSHGVGLTDPFKTVLLYSVGFLQFSFFSKEKVKSTFNELLES